MIKNNETLQYYLDMIKSKTNFKFLRFGDGEFLSIIDKNEIFIGGNEHHIFKELTDDLRYIIKNLNPKHLNALQPLVLTLPDLAKIIPDYNWYNSDVLHNASINGELYSFFESLKDRNVVIISCKKTREISKIINYSDFIEVRDVDCYYDLDMVLEKIKTYPEDTVFLFAASRLSVPCIYHTEREDITMIDAGSLFEPFINSLTRQYHKNMTEEIIKKNLGIYE